MPWPFGKKKTKESRSDSDASQTESAAASAVKSVAAKNKKSATLKHQTSNTTVSAAVAAATNAAATPHERLSRWLLRSKTRHEEPQIPPMVRNYKVPANLEELVTALTATEGTPFTRFLSNKKTSSVHLRLDLTTYQINYYTGGSTEGRPTASINLFFLQEIRIGEDAFNTKEFRMSSALSDGVDKECCMTILHGAEFRLKQFCIVAESPEIVQQWAEGLWAFARHVQPALYRPSMVLDRWLELQWQDMESNNSINLREVRAWMSKVNFKPSNRELRDFFDAVSKGSSAISKDGFKQLYHNIVEAKSVTNFFQQFSSMPSKTALTAADVKTFFIKEQGESTVSQAKVDDVMKQWGAEDGTTITLQRFVEYLFSADNSLWNPDEDLVYQDMSYPLACYFIASSHNTYLMGDQLRSESSTEAYVRCLRDGCRCLEIDCWDGPNNETIVYHGHTLTSKIKFHDVLEAIKANAFVTSDYPLILSIENHCSVSQQLFMANEFKRVFAEKLVIEPVDGCDDPMRDCYPSPDQLRHRIIIKHKKLKGDTDTVESSHKMEDDLAFTRKIGSLHLEDHINSTWYKHYFALSDSRLFYAEIEDDEDDEDEEDEDEQQDAVPTNEADLHFSEPWYHGNIDRDRSEDALRLYRDQEGTFLVRDSGTFRGEYTLSFVREGQPQHVRIRLRDEQYYLTDEVAFDSLYELIEYHRMVPLRGKDFTAVLQQAVPQPASHEKKNWFHKYITRAGAEDMLKRLNFDGAFLIRSSELQPTNFAISFRAEGKIKHCRIQKEGRMFCIGDAEYETLEALVDYFQRKPLYRRMKLRYPVDDKLLREQGTEPEEDIYRSDDLYQQPNPTGMTSNNTNVNCRALYPYAAAQPDELSFPAGATITNVVKKDGGWWQGDYGGRIGGWLPSNYVEEIDHRRMAKEEEDDHENLLGSLEKAFVELKHIQIVPREPRGGQQYIFGIMDLLRPDKGFDAAADSEDDMNDWIKAIELAVHELQQKSAKQARGNKKLRIHLDLSDLIYYSRSVRFQSFADSEKEEYYNMSSFNEKKALSFVKQNGGQPMEMSNYCIRQFARVYPQGKRVDSSNYDPQMMWNCGVQLVALNYQTGDRPMWLNHGFFQRNGRCGYVLKPERLLKLDFNPYEYRSFADDVRPVAVTIKVIAGRHLPKTSRGTTSPLVELEMCGVENDHNKFKTPTVPDNGFNPTWDSDCAFDVSMQDLATMRIVVLDEDIFGEANAIAQACFPLGSEKRQTLRTGYRAIVLKNGANEPFELASLLVHISVTHQNQDENYMSLQELRSRMCAQIAEQEDLVKQKLLKAHHGEVLDENSEARLRQLNKTLQDTGSQLMTQPSVRKARGATSVRR